MVGTGYKQQSRLFAFIQGENEFLGAINKEDMFTIRYPGGPDCIYPGENEFLLGAIYKKDMLTIRVIQGKRMSREAINKENISKWPARKGDRPLGQLQSKVA